MGVGAAVAVGVAVGAAVALGVSLAPALALALAAAEAAADAEMPGVGAGDGEAGGDDGCGCVVTGDDGGAGPALIATRVVPDGGDTTCRTPVASETIAVPLRKVSEVVCPSMVAEAVPLKALLATMSRLPGVPSDGPGIQTAVHTGPIPDGGVSGASDVGDGGLAATPCET